ncbi:MAG: arylsulfatase [Cytophagales bacterium]|nr:arylsulfatase [Cytophagales bacterium]
MKNKILFAIILCFIMAAYGCQTKLPERAKPNILFLLADDLGYGELGSYGQEVIKTPVLDHLAEQGMRFTDFYAGTSVCSPSRAVLMTGKHAGHATIRGNSGIFENDVWKRVPLRKDEITLGEMMKDAGYQTAFIGKWHLDDPNDESTWAMNRGFDYAVQEQWESRFGGKKFDEKVHWVNVDKDSIYYDQEKYDCIDVFRTNFALEYLDRKDKEKPFFLFMSYRIPHGHERYIRNKALYADQGWEERERRHAAKITLLDGQIGRLLKRLEQDGDLDHTLVLFTSDNGAHHEGHDHLFFESTGGLRGFKRDLYEGGIRTPFIAFWKDKIEQGRVSGHPGAFYDFMPTLAEVAGIRSPGTDGISVLPELLGNKQGKHDYLYWELQLDGWNRKLPKGGFRQAVRKGNWKAVRYGVDSRTELYNLEEDVCEAEDLAADYPELVRQMNRIFRDVRTDTRGFPYGGKIQDYMARDRYNANLMANK